MLEVGGGNCTVDRLVAYLEMGQVVMKKIPNEWKWSGVPW
jgi:hypothetical protein